MRTLSRLWKRGLLGCGVMGCALTGCVEQTLSVDSNPPGAIVYLNDQEVGRTPFETNFKWYGTYDVTLRKEGYTTLKTQAKVIAPAWNWIPLDLFAALWPTTFMDKHDLQFTLKPLSETEVDPAPRPPRRAPSDRARIRRQHPRAGDPPGEHAAARDTGRPNGSGQSRAASARSVTVAALRCCRDRTAVRTSPAQTRIGTSFDRFWTRCGGPQCDPYRGSIARLQTRFCVIGSVHA